LTPTLAIRIPPERWGALLLLVLIAGRGDLARAAPASAAGAPRQILFGDLHVHTTYSIDALVFALPPFGGEGAHPPVDACDFARYCSALDFFSLNDHAEGLTPERWQATKESVRRCNARAGNPASPELVAFAGWEWTQAGTTPENHYGHRNLVFRALADDQLPARPISSLSRDVYRQAPPRWLLRAPQLLRYLGLREYADFAQWLARLADTPPCEDGVDTRALPRDCHESAQTPEELFEKLNQWGSEALVIPHGLAWGCHAPPGARLDNQLTLQQHDPSRQRLLEIFSGHGNGEEYRTWPEAGAGEAGEPICPEPTRDHLPCCWRAGEIMRARCGTLSADECERRVVEARRLALEAGVDPHLVFPDTSVEDWLDCDQCRDCFKPAFALRPGETAQYSLAISSPTALDRNGRPLRFRWGFVASSDDHHARPGTGYKQYARRRMTDAHGWDNRFYEWLLRPRVMGRQRDARRAQPAERPARSLAALLDVERVASFMYTGGLVAVHATGRDRDAIWSALQRREVYGTSGPRILLWFDLLNGPDGRLPMGSEVVLDQIPRFEVRAAGAFVQKPGCPPESSLALGPERLARLCGGECYHPDGERHRIAAIEVVRIRPQREAGEPVARLIEDPWRRFECPPDPAGCVVTFEDPEYAEAGRDTAYYVRALQEQTPAINGANYRTELDAAGNAVRTSPCHGSYRTPAGDDCLAPVQERAWSSPIFADRPLAGEEQAAPSGHEASF
jgi:hypothetical protein